MDLTAFLQDLWQKTGKYDPLGHKIAETVAKTDSKATGSVAHALGWKWLENQADKNVQDPSRALAHGAQIYAAAIAAPYLATGYGAAASGTASAAEGASALSNGGMFANSGLSAAEQQAAQQAMQQALAEQAAQQAGQSALSSGGLFSQVPGAGAEQTALLNAQTADFGGPGADLTAKSAMPAVKDAFRAGTMGRLDYAGNVLKADAAGMNDPSVWLSRLGTNMDRIAGKAGQNMATRMATNALMPQQGGYQPAPQPMPQQQPQGPAQIVSPQQQAMQDFQAGRISADELRRRLGVTA